MEMKLPDKRKPKWVQEAELREEARRMARELIAAHQANKATQQQPVRSAQKEVRPC